MNFVNEIVSDIETGSIRAQSGASSAVVLDRCQGYCVTSTYTVNTPAVKTFADSNVVVLRDTIAIAAHGYPVGLKGQLTTTGTLPAGLSTGTDYFVIVVDAGNIQLAASLVDANAGTAVDITAAAGGGTHTFTATALAGGGVKLQASINGSLWCDVSSSSASVTTSGSTMWNVSNPYYKEVRIYYTLTAGQITTSSKIFAKGMEG